LLREVTDYVMRAVMQLLVELRGGTPPAEFYEIKERVMKEPG